MNELIEKENTAISSQSFRTDIMDLQEILLRFSERHIECPLQHHFSDGVYVREIMMPKDSVVIGKIHKFGHICIVNGDFEFVTEFSKERIKGFKVFVSNPGEKRAIRTYEDTTFITIHPTQETDLGELETMLISESYEDYEKFLLAEQDKLERLEVLV